MGTLGLNLHEIPLAQCVGCGLTLENPLMLAQPFCDGCDLSDYAASRPSYGAGLPRCHICAEPIFPCDANATGDRHRWCDRLFVRLETARAARAAARHAREDAYALNAA